MKHGILTAALTLPLCIATGPASAKTACPAVLAKIEAKLASKGITKFTLLIVSEKETTDLRVVGTCDGGAKKIIYKRG